MIKDLESNWYAVSILYRSERNGVASDKELWEESIVLFNAIDEADAIQMAKVFGKGSEVAYKTVGSDELHWKFYAIGNVNMILGPIDNGIEIFSRFLTASEAQSLLNPFPEN